MTAHELAATRERRPQARALDHHDRDDDRPPGEQHQPGHDEEHQPDQDADAGDEARRDQRPQHGRRRAQELAQRHVAPAVLDVADRLHHHALEPEAGDDGDREEDDREARAVRAAQEAFQHGERDEEQQGGRQDEPGLRPVGGDGTADHLADVDGPRHRRGA